MEIKFEIKLESLKKLIDEAKKIEDSKGPPTHRTIIIDNQIVEQDNYRLQLRIDPAFNHEKKEYRIDGKAVIIIDTVPKK